jgi:hypothetical protein
LLRWLGHELRSLGEWIWIGDPGLPCPEKSYTI